MKVLKRIINFLSYIRKPIIDLRNEMIGVRLIDSLDKYTNEIVLLKIPIQKCVTGVFWKLDKSNPFVESLMLKDNNVLTNYYKQFQPSTVNELFSINLKNEFGEMSSYAYVFPWDKESPGNTFSRRERVALNENKRQGLQNLTLLEGGHTDFGPASIEKIAVEVRRINQLFLSIQKKGYKENFKKDDGGIKGYFLADKDSRWKFYITSGKHRAYVLAALGYVDIPVILNKNKKTVKYILDEWEQVTNGNFTEQQASIIFNNFLEL